MNSKAYANKMIVKINKLIKKKFKYKIYYTKIMNFKYKTKLKKIYTPKYFNYNP